MTFDIKSVDELTHVAHWILHSHLNHKIFCLEGEIGAGKTHLVKAFGKLLKAKDPIHSPTFNIVNEYQLEDGTAMYHIDLYRLQSERELQDIGIEEYIYSGNYCFIEWHQLAKTYIPTDSVIIRIDKTGENERRILVE